MDFFFYSAYSRMSSSELGVNCEMIGCEVLIKIHMNNFICDDNSVFLFSDCLKHSLHFVKLLSRTVFHVSLDLCHFCANVEPSFHVKVIFEFLNISSKLLLPCFCFKIMLEWNFMFSIHGLDKTADLYNIQFLYVLVLSMR